MNCSCVLRKQIITMNKLLVITSFVLVSLSAGYAQEWKPAGDKIMTTWGENVDPTNPHPEYPRPQLKRQGNWKNLNGLWKYTIVDKDVSEIPAQWDGDILVPFAVESALSGV